MFAKFLATDLNEFYNDVYVSPIQTMPGFYRIVSKDKTQEHIINGRRITVIYPETSETDNLRVVEG